MVGIPNPPTFSDTLVPSLENSGDTGNPEGRSERENVSELYNHPK